MVNSADQDGRLPMKTNANGISIDASFFMIQLLCTGCLMRKRSF
jgi:hypothetical protein